MNKITISKASYLAVASSFQAQQDVRYFLNGVCIRHRATGLSIEATDGHRAISISDAKAFCEEEFTAYILDFTTEQISAFKKVSNKDAIVTIRILEDGSANIEHCGVVSPARIIDGTFPDVDNIIPATNAKNEAGVAPCFQSHYLVDFSKALKVLGQSKRNNLMSLHQRGESEAARIDFPKHPNVVGVLMPVRV